MARATAPMLLGLRARTRTTQTRSSSASESIASYCRNKTRSREHLQSVFLDDSQELERHAAGLLGAGLPLLHRGFTGVQVAGKDRLADAMALAKLLDLAGLECGGSSKARAVEAPHGGLVDCADFEQRQRRGMNRLVGVTLVFAIPGHGRKSVAPSA